MSRSGFQTRSYDLTPCNVRLLRRCFLLHLFPKLHSPIKKQHVQYHVKAFPVFVGLGSPNLHLVPLSVIDRWLAWFVGHRELKRVEQGSWPDNYPLAMIKGDLKTVEDPSTQDIFIAHHDYRGRLDWRESNDFYAA